MTASITPTASSPHHPASNPFITNINQNPPLGAATNGTGTHNVKFVQYSERVKFQPPAPQNINVGTNITHPTHIRPSTNENNETTIQQQQQTQQTQQTQVKQERALSNKSTFRLQWTHKKGKPKPQQFWIYCEEAQQNYVRVELLSNGFTWSASSRVMRINSRPSCVAFIENIFGKEERLEALIFDISSTPINPVVEAIPASDLSEIQASEFTVLFQIKEDDSFPKHPHQGRPEEVRIQQSVLNDAQIPTPFCYIGKFTFKNRAEGWFRLGAALHYKGTPLFEGYSDLFMFNNPRMIRKKQMSCYQPTEIKFMQVYSLSNDRTEEQWLELGKQLDFTPQHTLELLQNAQLIFKKALSSSARTNNSRRKRLRDSETPGNVDDEFSPSLKRSTSAPSSTSTSTVGYPSAPTTLPPHFPTRSHSNLSAMQHPSRSLSQSPPHSTIQPNSIPSRGTLMHSQLPLMSQTYHPLPSASSPSSSQFSHLTGYSSLQMNSAQIPSRTQALVLPHIHQTGDNEYKSFSRPLPSIVNIPQAAPIINTSSTNNTVSSNTAISQQLSVSPSQPMDIVNNNDENVISVYYQFLTPQLKLESTSLHSIRCLKTTSIDQFIKSVQQCNPSQPHIRHLYIHSGAKGTCELMDTLDLISYFKSQSFPKILISSHDDVHQPNPDVFLLLPKFVFSVREQHDDQQVYKIFTNSLKISELQGAIAKNFKKTISQIASLEHNGERITAQTLKDYKDILFEAITVHWI